MNKKKVISIALVLIILFSGNFIWKRVNRRMVIASNFTNNICATAGTSFHCIDDTEDDNIKIHFSIKDSIDSLQREIYYGSLYMNDVTYNINYNMMLLNKIEFKEDEDWIIIDKDNEYYDDIIILKKSLGYINDNLEEFYGNPNNVNRSFKRVFKVIEESNKILLEAGMY